MPDDPALAAAVAIPFLDPFQRRFDHEVLLIAGDLTDAVIKDIEPECQFQQP